MFLFLEVLFPKNRRQMPCKGNVTKSGFGLLESLPSDFVNQNCIFSY